MKSSPFSIILLFVALMIAGLVFISRLNVNLYPSETLPSFRISFWWSEIPARTVESAVTSKLEAALSMLNGVNGLGSTSSYGWGNIHISFNKGTDMDMTRFEIASTIRKLYPALPKGVSYPEITTMQASGSKNNLLLYSIIIPETHHELNHYLNSVIQPALSSIDGINNVAFFGVRPWEYNIVFDTGKLSKKGISPGLIASAINNCFQDVQIGRSDNGFNVFEPKRGELPVVMRSGGRCFRSGLQSIPIKKVSGRVIYLGDVAEMDFRERVPRSYYRVNGKNTILMAVDATGRENRIRLAARVTRAMEQIKQDLPESWEVYLSYDDTVHIRNDLNRVVLRMLLSMLVLLALVVFITRNHQYLFLVLLTIVANVLIAACCYYALNIEIHLYSLAGIAVSFGMIIDNSIVMVEHLRRHNNKAVFLAMLAATLTTAGSLLLVFLLDHARQVILKDFAAVMLVNLFVSLIIAWFFIPSVYHYSKRLNNGHSRPGRWLITCSRLYLRWLHWTQRYRYAMVFLLVMAFGLPVQYLPAGLASEGAAARFYNKTIGSDLYRNKIKTRVEKVFGGSLRLFADKVVKRSYHVDPERTSLLIRARMPGGASVHQLNEAVMRMEKHLLEYPQAEQFQTQVLSYENASIRVFFKPEFDNEGFPLYLKWQLTDKALSIGSAEWEITGAGKGFSNVGDGPTGQVSIILEGYNYEMLHRIAEKLQKLSQKNPRITKQTISSVMSKPGVKNRHEILATFDEEQLAFMELTASEVLRALPGRDEPQTIRPAYHEGRQTFIQLMPGNQASNNIWDVKNKIITVNELHVKPKTLMSFEKRLSDTDIHKHNQQYRLFFHFDFEGPYRLKELVAARLVEDISRKLPVGYDARQPEWGWMDNKNKDYRLIFLVIVIIFFLCAILFESLRRPLAVLCVIPIAFIGLFLTFYVFNLNFDQGGLAAFLLLCGLSVNAALYLLNDYNLFQKKYPRRSHAKKYLKALHYKISPISLTVISTTTGLAPFVIGPKEPFWFAFAAGTIGGLLFSLGAVVFFLPLFLKLNSRKL